MSETKGGGLRYDAGKPRYDLVHPWAHEQMVRVLTKGATKYEAHNWERGMAWSKVLASLERHLAAVKKGEDYDYYPDTCEGCRTGTCTNHTGELHAAQIACNAHFLTAYYKIYPQGDDRVHTYLERPRIGLDIDDVLADWVTTWCAHHGQDVPSSWQFDRAIHEKFDRMQYDGSLDEFYLSLPAKCSPEELTFEPACYVTSRPVSSHITERWLDKMGFPAAPVITVGLGKSKVEVLKEAKVDIFVDDRFENFVELNRAGICCFLYDARHNQRYDVGYKRIRSLRELVV